MDISLFLMTVCHPQRLNWLVENVTSINSQNFYFKNKYIFADEFNGWKFPVSLKQKLELLGYEVFIDSHKSRIKSMDHAFSVIKTEYVFYNEEDVISIFPQQEEVHKIFNIQDEDRRCGMISLTLGGSTNHFPEGKYGDLREAKNNIIYSSKDWFAFKRLEEHKNDYFFEFPGLFIRTELFKETHEAAKKFNNSQIEVGLTKGYFDKKFEQKFFKCSIAKNNFNYLLESSEPVNVFYKSRLLNNLDPNQGSSPFGGGHNY